jgi:V/A-type H+-transporting ATPase subunit K
LKGELINHLDEEVNSLNSKKPIFIHLVVVTFVSLVLVGTLLFERGQVSATEAPADEVALAATAGAGSSLGVVASAEAAEAEHGEKEAAGKESNPLKPLAAALALGLGAIGTAMAQMKIGAAGAGAIAERPEVATMFIVMIALPETIVILGFVVAAMIIMF